MNLQKKLENLKTVDIYDYEAKAESLFRETRNVLDTYRTLFNFDFQKDLNRIYKVRGSVQYRITHLEPLIEEILRQLNRTVETTTNESTKPRRKWLLDVFVFVILGVIIYFLINQEGWEQQLETALWALVVALAGGYLLYRLKWN